MDTPQAENSTIVRSNNEPSESIMSTHATHATHASHDDTTLAPRPTQASWLRRDWRMSLLRTWMRVLSRTAPSRAVSLFDRLWFSAPRTHPNRDAAAWLAQAEPLEVRVHGRRVAAWVRGHGPTVLLVHGWGGNAGQMLALAEPLLAQGFRVVLFDAPAHGASEPSRLGGRRVSMIEIADALRVVAAAAGPIAGLVAHSGGCTATALALRDGWRGPQRIVFVAPFALPSEAIEPFGRAIGASAAVTARFHAQVERRLARPWSDFDMSGLAQRRTVPPLLVVHDRDDREVPPFHGTSLVHAWPGARLLETGGLGHRRVLRDPAVVADIGRFLALLRTEPVRSTPAQARHELDRAHAGAGFAWR